MGTGGTLTATLSPAPTAAGSLSVSSSDATVASVPGSVAFAAGQSSVAIAVSALAPGTATITASANGGQTTATVNVDAPPSINITSPGANSVYQAGANIAIVADAADPDGTVVRVDFYQGAMLLGSSSAVPYSFTWTNVPPGSYSLTAVASDNQGATSTSAAVTIRVNAPPIVTLTSPTNGATFTASATIPLIATAADSDGSVTQVDFYQGSTFIGSASGTPYTFSWTNVTAGSYALTARATDNDGAVAISDVVNITVNSGVAQIYYIVPDHLNTPRLIANSTGTTVWRWDQAEPFGDSAPNDDPNGTGNRFDFPLGLSLYYRDKETGTLYASQRDCYNPAIGRFCQSDPIGLAGGMNTYLYVKGNPIGYFDPEGLFLIAAHAMSRDSEVAQNATVISSVGTGVGVVTIGTVGVGVVAGYTPSVIAGVATAPEVAAACYRILKSDPCKNAILAAALGATICGNASGTVKDSAREYVRTRERLQEILDASERASRANGTTGISP